MIVAALVFTIAAPPPSRTADTSLIVSTAWLAQHAADRAVVLIQVDANDSAYRAGHIPGARFLPYQAIIAEVNGLSTELPPVDSLRAHLEALDVSNSSHVVLTGSPLTVARAFFTLDYLGLRNVSVLDGGVAKWRAEGRRVEEGVGTKAVARGHLVVTAHPEIVATSDWIAARVASGGAGLALVDTRHEDEYLGRNPASTGHIAGARRLEWEEMFTSTTEFALKDRATIEQMWRSLAAPGDTVVAYCRVGHRSSATYFVARLLGYPVKLYDGSYQDWSARGMALVKTATGPR
ncbi:MAG TPA: rhodanese-like domain-containing protein [Gemmatimonadales bacterium]|jgi:thiosulfate/3-mercaptopyruvate sulfurtransferase